MDSTNKFIEYYRSGNIDDIKQISKNPDQFGEFNEGIYINKLDEIECCDIVKCLIELFKDGSIYLRRFLIEFNFTQACYYGHYKIIKYLIELYKENTIYSNNYGIINIQSNNDNLPYACYKGHYRIIKYLIELYKKDKNYKRIYIYQGNENCLRVAYRAQHYMIVKYLMTICKKHKYEPFNNYLFVFGKLIKYII